MSQLTQDVRFALRQMRRSPFYCATVLLTLTLALGATAALTGVLRATLLHAVPYPNAGRLILAGDRNIRNFQGNGLMSVARTADFAAMEKGGQRILESTAFFYADPLALTLAGHEPAMTASTAVSGDFFRVTGTAPLLGRVLTASDDVPNGPQVAVLSYRLWLSQFGGDQNVIGRSVRLGTYQATVIGVMPAGFDLPSGTELWHPGHVFAANFGPYRGEGSRFVQVVARIKPSFTLADVNTAAEITAQRLARSYPETDGAWAFAVDDVRSTLFGEYRRALWLLSAAVGLVLLVAVVNIAGLQLSRNARRAPEFAVRGALGVTQQRLARQLLTESLLLTLAGCITGGLAAAALLRLLASHLPQGLLVLGRPHLDAATLAIGFGVALLVATVTALLPVRFAVQASLNLRSAGSFSGSTRSFGRRFSVAQIALSLVLLSLSAAVLSDLYRLLQQRLGFDTTNVQTFTIDFPWGYDPAKSLRVYERVEDALKNTAGVSGAGAITALPLSGFSSRNKFDVYGQPPTREHDAIVAEGRSFTPGYLNAMRIPLLAGRSFTAQDHNATGDLLLMVNQAFVQRYFPQTGAVGQRLVSTQGADGKPYVSRIIGVTGDVVGTGGDLRTPPRPEVYYAADGGWPHMQFAVRSSIPPQDLRRTLNAIVSSLDSSASVGDLSALSAGLDRQLAQPRWNAALLSGFGLASLLLVIVGIYGLVAFDLEQRIREIALRIALGATRARVLGLLLRESVLLLAAGLLLGALGSYAAQRLLHAAVAGISTGTVVAALAGTAVLLSAAVMLATLLPARRAVQVDPMQVMRAE